MRLERLVRDARAKSAQEVFLGHPATDRYEFLANDVRYGGRIHEKVYGELLKRFHHTYRIEHTLEDDALEKILLSLTRSYDRPVICVTWVARVPHAVTKPIVQVAPKGNASMNGHHGETLQAEPHYAVPSVSLPTPRVAEPVEPLQPAPPRVLLVEDDARFSIILSRILESKGYAVTRASNGKEAVSFFEEEEWRHDLVICDVHMPRMDGPTFLRKLRAAKISTPVLMLTSDDEPLLQAELAMMGADSFVRKQEDPRVLLAWCKNLVARRDR